MTGGRILAKNAAKTGTIQDMNETVSLQDAAEMLGVSRRRAQQLVDANVLSGEVVGNSRVIDVKDIGYVKRVTRNIPGQPLTPGNAWAYINNIINPRSSPDRLDNERRRVRPRAVHELWYVHPSIRKRLRNATDRRHVFSGSDAAAAHDVPVGGPDELLHLYIRDIDRHELEQHARPQRSTPSRANLVVHVVPHDVWPFHGERYAALNLAWLDMADHDERGANMVLEEWKRR